MIPYEYTEPGTNVKLQIGPSNAELGEDAPGARLVIDGPFVDVEPSDVPAVALALYEAAGLPEPLILSRPERAGGIEHAGRDDRHAYTSRSGAKVLVGWRGIKPGELDPDEALEFAAHIAVNAEAIKQGEPDPGDVEALADVLRQHCGGGPASYLPVARAVLPAGYKREPEQ